MPLPATPSRLERVVVFENGDLVTRHVDVPAGVARLAADCARRFPAHPLHLVDEGFSSREARLSLVLGGMPRRKREEKGATDRVAAALILQRFLDSAP
jgi:putative Holliday junction resolvase